MTRILNQIVNHQTTMPEIMFDVGVFLIIIILILMLSKKISFKVAVFFLIGSTMIVALGLHIYKCQCANQLKQITNIAKEHPTMSVAKVNRNDYIFY